MPFNKVHTRIKEGKGTLCNLLQWCCPEGCHTSGEVPQKWIQACILVETKAAPIEEPTEESVLAEISAEEAIPLEEPTKEMSPAVAPMEDAAPMEEPNEEPATLMAMATGATEEPGVPPVPCKEKEEGEVPHSSYPGWMEVLHPSWTVTPLGKPLWLWASWGGNTTARVQGKRKVQDQRATGHQQAMLEEDDSSPSLECPEAIPRMALPPGFKGVVACLLRIHPPWLPLSPPEPGQPDTSTGPCGDNSVHHPNNSGWGHWGHIPGHSNCLSVEGGPWEPLHGSQPSKTYSRRTDRRRFGGRLPLNV